MRKKKEKKELESPLPTVQDVVNAALNPNVDENPCPLNCEDCLENWKDHALCHKRTTQDVVEISTTVNELIDKVNEMYEWFKLAEEKFHLKSNKAEYEGMFG